MIDHESAVGGGLAQYPRGGGVYLIYHFHKAVVTFHIEFLAVGVDGGEGFHDVAGYGSGVGERGPNVRLHSTVVMVMMVCGVGVGFGFGVGFCFGVWMVRGMGFFEDEVDAFGHVEHLQVGGVVGELVHPRLLEADVADFEIGFAPCQLNELLRCGVVGFGTAAAGDHAFHFKAVARNGFGEEAERLYGDGYRGALLRLCFLGLARSRSASDKYGCGQ